MKYFIIRLSHILLFVLMLSGCVFKENYPKKWNQINDTSNKPLLINGSFKCNGKNENNLYKTSIIYALDLKIIHTNKTCNIVHIKQVDINQIHFTLIYKDKTILKTLLNLNLDYFYDNNQLFITKKNECTSTNGVILCSSARTKINITKNHDLVMKNERYSGGTVLLVIPVAGYENNWVLFENIKN